MTNAELTLTDAVSTPSVTTISVTVIFAKSVTNDIKTYLVLLQLTTMSILCTPANKLILTVSSNSYSSQLTIDNFLNILMIICVTLTFSCERFSSYYFRSYCCEITYI